VSTARSRPAETRARTILNRVAGRALPVSETLVLASDLDPVGTVVDDIALFNDLGLEVARRYGEGTWSWEFADGVANDLFLLMQGRWKLLEPEGKNFHPTLFWQVFEAFDGGEYRRKGDDSTVDPVEKYTNPAIADVLQHDWPIDE